MLADPTETTVVERELARTYNSTPAYDDPADVLDDYERVMDYVAHHPEAGDHAVSTSLGLPRSRISTWMDGGKPAAVHGIDDATDRGWLADSSVSVTIQTTSEVIRGRYTWWVTPRSECSTNSAKLVSTSAHD